MRIRRRTPRLPRPLWRGRATSPRLPRPRRGGRATPPRQPALPDTPVARLEALTGARQEWLLRCRHALAAGPAALDGLLTGSPEIGEALTEDARTGWSGVAATPALSAAEAMLRTAQALAADDPPPPAAARHWRAASVLLPARPADERGEPEVSDRPAADFVRLLGEVLGGDPPRRVASATVPVLLYRPRQRIGLRADLTLTCVAGGPPGLHPDPEAMAFGLGDAGFVAGLEAAWAQSPLAARKRCVLWSVTDGSGAPVNDIAQGSLGAAFGLALDELRRRLRPVMGRFSFRLLRRVHVLSGRLRPDGGLEAVGGLRAKLQVAKDAGYRVILPRDNRAEAERHARELGVRLCYAADLPRALRLARRVHLWRVAGALALVLLLVGGVLGGKWLLTQADRQRAAERAELVGGSRSLAALSRSTADTDPQLADLYAAAAWDMAQTPEAEAAADAALHRPLRAVLRAGDWAAFTSADALLVDATDSVRLWDPSSGKPTGPAWQPRAGSWGTERPTARAVSLDGSRFAVGETGGVVRVRPLTEGGLEPLVDVTLIEAHPRMTVVAVALSPDGSLLATAGSPIAPRDEELFEHDRTVRLWDARTGDPRGAVLTGHQGALRALAFSPDGDMLITGSRAGRPGHESAPTLQVWDAATGEPAGVEPPQEPGVTALDVSPDGTMLAAGGEDGRTRLWNMVTGDQLAEPLDGRSDAVTAVRFATGPEGRLADVLATSGTDGTVRLWVAAVGVELAVYDTGGRSVGSLSFSPDGTALSAADDSGTVRVWDVGPAHGPGTALLDRSAQSVSVAYAPDGEAFVTAGWDGLLLRREAARPDAVRVLARTAGPLRGVAFAPDGGVVATAGGDGR
ncbi:WD40 repeat domain-containing protein, partial [Streptomyces sp. JJ38]